MPTDLFLAQSPPANLMPVHFDFGAAQAAITALRNGAKVVDRSARARVRDAKDAETHWTGGQRQLFDRMEKSAATEASQLGRALNAAADQIEDDVKDARAENTRRAAALKDWKQDLADARRREIEARNKAAAGKAG